MSGTVEDIFMGGVLRGMQSAATRWVSFGIQAMADDMQELWREGQENHGRAKEMASKAPKGRTTRTYLRRLVTDPSRIQSKKPRTGTGGLKESRYCAREVGDLKRTIKSAVIPSRPCDVVCDKSSWVQIDRDDEAVCWWRSPNLSSPTFCWSPQRPPAYLHISQQI